MGKVSEIHPGTVASGVEIVSFFSGAGFLDLGFEKAGAQIAYMNEIYKPFTEAYRYSRLKMNIPEPTHGYHEETVEAFLSGKDKKKLSDIISSARSKGNLVGFIGGPPCPDFSVGGKNKGETGENGRLSGTYIQIIAQQKPDFFIFENVRGLWRTKRHREFYDQLKVKLSQSGYVLFDKLINAISYGAPQDRDRIILFGVHKSVLEGTNSTIDFQWNKYAKFEDRTAFAFNWPETEKFKVNSIKDMPRGLPKELTVEYWFKKNKVDKHPNGKHCFTPKAGLEKFKVILEGDDSKKSYKRLHRWRYSPTACYGNNEVHLHPYLARRISAAEALALQSLPKEFELPPTMSLTDMFKTIGNGVPFLAAYALAQTILDYFKEVRNEKNNSGEYCERYSQVAAE